MIYSVILFSVIVVMIVVALYFCLHYMLDCNDENSNFIYGSWINEYEDIIIISLDTLTLCAKTESGDYRCREEKMCIKKCRKLTKFIPGLGSNKFVAKNKNLKIIFNSNSELGTIEVIKDGKYFGKFAKNTLVNI